MIPLKKTIPLPAFRRVVCSESGRRTLKRPRSSGHIKKPLVTFRTEGDEIAWIGARSSSMATWEGYGGDNGGRTPRVALLVDGDNVGPKYLGPLIADLGAYGRVVIRKVFCNWSVNSGWKTEIIEHAAEGVHAAAEVSGKNSTDVRMVVSAMDILHSNSADAFCIASSDSDFTPLAMRLRESGVEVFGAGKHTASKGFVSACDKFINVDELLAAYAKMEAKEHLAELAKSSGAADTQQVTSRVVEASGASAVEVREAKISASLPIAKKNSSSGASKILARQPRDSTMMSWLTNILSGNKSKDGAASSSPVLVEGVNKDEMLMLMSSITPGYPTIGELVSACDALGLKPPDAFPTWSSYFVSDACDFLTIFEFNDANARAPLDDDSTNALRCARSLHQTSSQEEFNEAARALYYYIGSGDPVRFEVFTSGWNRVYGGSVKKYGFKNFRNFIEQSDCFDAVRLNTKRGKNKNMFITLKDKSVEDVGSLSAVGVAGLLHKNA